LTILAVNESDRVNARMVEHSVVVGITTNSTIFAKAIGSDAAYVEQALLKRCLRNETANLVI
jgi:transaldolase